MFDKNPICSVHIFTNITHPYSANTQTAKDLGIDHGQGYTSRLSINIREISHYTACASHIYAQEIL